MWVFESGGVGSAFSLPFDIPLTLDVFLSDNVIINHPFSRLFALVIVSLSLKFQLLELAGRSCVCDD